MKRTVSLLIVFIAAFVILCTEQAFGQDKTPVKVKNSVVYERGGRGSRSEGRKTS